MQRSEAPSTKAEVLMDEEKSIAYRVDQLSPEKIEEDLHEIEECFLQIEKSILEKNFQKPEFLSVPISAIQGSESQLLKYIQPAFQQQSSCTEDQKYWIRHWLNRFETNFKTVKDTCEKCELLPKISNKISNKLNASQIFLTKFEQDLSEVNSLLSKGNNDEAYEEFLRHCKEICESNKIKLTNYFDRYEKISAKHKEISDIVVEASDFISTNKNGIAKLRELIVPSKTQTQPQTQTSPQPQSASTTERIKSALKKSASLTMDLRKKIASMKQTETNQEQTPPNPKLSHRFTSLDTIILPPRKKQTSTATSEEPKDSPRP